MKWFESPESITVITSRKTCVILKDHPQFDEIKTALHTDNYNEETIFMLLDPAVIAARDAVMQ